MAFDEKIHDAAKQFKKALENMGKKNVVLIYAYTEEVAENSDAMYSGFVSDNFILTLGVCDVVRNDLLNGKA